MNISKWININWYLSKKPYARHTDYDLFYLDICRNVFSLIRNLATRHREEMELSDEDCRELAYIITAYFEDEVNGIGFWQSLVQLHQQQFGKRLPFFNPAIIAEQQADSDDILPADMHYLLYISLLSLLSEPNEPAFLFFENPFYGEAAAEIYDYLAGITEVETTGFYDTYLVPPDDYVAFKGKIDWFVYNSYLTGIEFTCRIGDYIFELQKMEKNPEMKGPFLYAEKDRLLFEKPSLFTAFFPVDILAGALRCGEAKKEKIRALKLRPHGLFRVENETAEGYSFIHTATGETFYVLKRTMASDFDHTAAMYWLTTLAEWDGAYNLSGLCFPMRFNGEDLAEYNLKHQHEFQRHYLPYREQLIKTSNEFREKVVGYFGAELVTFTDGNALLQAVNEFYQWHFDTVTKGKKAGAKPVATDLPPKLKKTKNLSLFLPPGDNMEFLIGHAENLATLQAPDPERIPYADRDAVIDLLEEPEVDAGYWFYLRRQFAIPNLSFILRCNVESEEDFEALLRIYKPRDFSPLKLPRMTIFSSEELPVEKVQEIINKK